MAQKMKLSDALEAGWKIAPQSWEHGYGIQNPDGTWAGADPFGAAVIGVDPAADDDHMGVMTFTYWFPVMLDRIPDSKLPPSYPKQGLFPGEFLETILETLHDKLHWPAADIVTFIRNLGY